MSPDILAILAHLPLFQELNPEQLQSIAAGTRERRLPRGELLFQKGDVPRGFYVIVVGQVKLAFPSVQGHEKVVDIMGPRQSFGEAVMFMDRPYPVFAEAVQDALLLHVSQGVVFDMIDSDPCFARKLLAGLSQRVIGLVQDVEWYSLRSSVQRVIGYLLDHCPDTSTLDLEKSATLTLPTSKQNIASRLNLTPETLSRVFHDLTERGLIQVSGKDILIADIDALRKFDI